MPEAGGSLVVEVAPCLSFADRGNGSVILELDSMRNFKVPLPITAQPSIPSTVWHSGSWTGRMVNRIDKDGNINDCHFIGERAVAAAHTINLRHGWKDPMEIREEHLQQITDDCMDILKSLPRFDLPNYVSLLTRRGYNVKLQRDKENVVKGNSIKKGNSSYKSSELGTGRNQMPSQIEATWRSLHPIQRPMAVQAPKSLDSKSPVSHRLSTAQASPSTSPSTPGDI